MIGSFRYFLRHFPHVTERNHNKQQNMADIAGPSVETIEQNAPISDENQNEGEPPNKKAKLDDSRTKCNVKLEDRLNGILCCAVCLDLPPLAVYQCSNGHLMCASCMAHLLADGRLKDETATCPNCRCEINRSVCTRNLAVEKAISELPTECRYCSDMLPRNSLDHHELNVCQERQVLCKFEKIGCTWRGPFHKQGEHEQNCSHPKKSGLEVMESLNELDTERSKEFTLYKELFGLLSFEKITFNDLQMRPYRTDDFTPKLYYETSRFSALNYQWVVKAHVNDNQKNPNLSLKRSLSYQLVLKTKISNPLNLQYVALKGPYGEMRINPAICSFEFSNDSQESPFNPLPIASNIECNKQLAAKTINFRLILFQIPK